MLISLKVKFRKTGPVLVKSTNKSVWLSSKDQSSFGKSAMFCAHLANKIFTRPVMPTNLPVWMSSKDQSSLGKPAMFCAQLANKIFLQPVKPEQFRKAWGEKCMAILAKLTDRSEPSFILTKFDWALAPMSTIHIVSLYIANVTRVTSHGRTIDFECIDWIWTVVIIKTNCTITQKAHLCM